jgi:hypothetical protein
MRNIVPPDFSEHDPALIQALSDAYDQEGQDKHDMGAVKYGPLKFTKANTIDEAMQELVDFGNYMRYTWIKLALLKAQAMEFEEVLEQLKNQPKVEMSSPFVNPFKKDLK